jgi:hypothetical protein
MKIRGFEGTLSLDEMQTQIRFEEAGGLELIDCVVGTDKNNQPINICKFEELASITVPKDIILVKANESNPGGTKKKVLTDTLVIQGQFTNIEFYR